MRTRRRIAALVVSAAALGVGFIAFPASSAAAPPVVPTCAFPAGPGSDSCGTLKVDGVAPPVGAAYENIKLGIRVRSQFTPTTSETTSVNLKFDDDIALNLAGIPSCPSSELTGKNISAAYEQCGPNADGNPPTEGNAFLSAAGNVSGLGSTVPPANLTACTMIFKGATNNSLTIYARAPVANATPGATTRRPTPGDRRQCCSRAPDEPARGVALRPDAQRRQHPHLESLPGRLLRDGHAWSRLPGEVPGWDIPPQDAGDLGLHRRRRCERHAQLDGSVPVAELDS